MAIAFTCDGCTATIPRHQKREKCSDLCPKCRLGHEGEAFGRLEPAHYCPTCAAAWRAHDVAVQKKRVELVRGFEAWVRKTEKALGKTLARLPDA